MPDPIAGRTLAGDKESVTAVKRWRVLLNVEKDRDALWLVEALEHSDSIGLAWVARDSEEALLYLAEQDVYANRAKFPRPNVVIINSARPHAGKLLQAAYRLSDPQVIVQLTSKPDVTESLWFMAQGADCSQPKPTSLAETIAFVDWLEDWLSSITCSVDADNDRILAFPGVLPRRDIFKNLIAVNG